LGIGEAAHIRAAAPGGPRYDENQTPEERASSKNGIFLCPNCARIVDRDESAYSPDDLYRLKDMAERQAVQRWGKAPPHAPILRTPSQISREIQLYCLSEGARQEQLDPRFSVSVEFGKDGLVSELHATQRVAMRLMVGSKDRARYSKALTDFREYGGSETFEDIDVRMEGSPLFPAAEVACKRLKISTESRPVNLTVALGASSDSAVFLDCIGTASHGQKGLRITGSALGGLVTATFVTDFFTHRSSFTFQFDVEQWARKPVLRLPHFNQLKRVLQNFKQGTVVKTHFVLNGIEAEVGEGRIAGGNHFYGLRFLLSELDVLRRLDTFFNLALATPEDLDDVVRDHGDVDQVLSMIDVC
jgi:hypothetical protein